jgi:heme/copper-type cytochrome/quinol oxidase subunit 2
VEALVTDLAWLFLAVAALVFLAVQALLLVSALRTPRTAPPDPRPPNTPRYRLSRGWEVVWTLLPALGLLLLGLLGAQALLARPPSQPATAPPTPAGPSGTLGTVPPPLVSWPGGLDVNL